LRRQPIAANSQEVQRRRTRSFVVCRLGSRSRSHATLSGTKHVQDWQGRLRCPTQSPRPAPEVIVKPASPRLIAAKLHRLVEIANERPGAAGDERRKVVRLGALRLDPRRAAASVGDVPLALTTGEFELLLLASRPGEFVHRDTIARTLGSPASGAGEGRRSADMHVCRIRKKLRDAGAHSLRVETVYGRGYCLRLEEEVAEELFAARYPQWCA
jgi:DNA-binding winged helix-turn-helix (wHTH) protein